MPHKVLLSSTQPPSSCSLTVLAPTSILVFSRVDPSLRLSTLRPTSPQSPHQSLTPRHHLTTSSSPRPAALPDVKGTRLADGSRFHAPLGVSVPVELVIAVGEPAGQAVRPSTRRSSLCIRVARSRSSEREVEWAWVLPMGVSEFALYVQKAGCWAWLTAVLLQPQAQRSFP